MQPYNPGQGQTADIPQIFRVHGPNFQLLSCRIYTGPGRSCGQSSYLFSYINIHPIQRMISIINIAATKLEKLQSLKYKNSGKNNNHFAEVKSVRYELQRIV